nr:PREDICTED: ubiquitin-protein ligase E3B [Bemisia tabaci]
MFEKDPKQTFLEQTKAARAERAFEKKREEAAVRIQAHVRGWSARNSFTKTILDEFDENAPDIQDTWKKPSLSLYRVFSRFLSVWKKERDKQRFEKLCKYLVVSLKSESVKFSYIGVPMNKEYALSWIDQIKKILSICCTYLEELHPESSADKKTIICFLHTLVAYTSTNTWVALAHPNFEKLRPGMNQLCANIMGHLVSHGFYTTLKTLLMRGLSRSKVVLTNISLSALLTLATRPLFSSNLSDNLVSIFLVQILSVPALVSHIRDLAPEYLNTLQSHRTLERCLEFLSSPQEMQTVFDSLEASYALCLIGNLIHLVYLYKSSLSGSNLYPAFTVVINNLLQNCKNYVVSKQSNLTHWHPILGWFSQPIDPSLREAMPHVRAQLFLLWSQPLISALLGVALREALEVGEVAVELPPPPPSSNIIIRALESKRNSNGKNYKNKLGNPEVVKVAQISSLYYTTITTLTQLKLDILSGLCYQDNVLHLMWKFLVSLGPNCGLKNFLELLAMNSKCTAPEFGFLILFCECMSHYVTILDDVEMYEHQQPFTLVDLTFLSSFLNLFLFKVISNNFFDTKNLSLSDGLFHSSHSLLMILYRRDCRRNFTPPSHWLIRDLKVSAFMNDLDKNKKTSQILLKYLPHILPHSERVQLFRKYVANEKSHLGISDSAYVSTLITVHRNRMVEDGYRQLALLPPQSLKGVIRVRFINEQSLSEAGVDRDGVFKEFLEETIKRVFDPSLNLFRATAEERLYPSPTSSLQDNHLQLFEFVGRMLAKAVYEGIVVDVPFASFFLSQVLGQTQQALYSFMDELPSLDKELYRSLTYIKHYKGDVSELDLTFIADEDCLGKVMTHELVPGGRAVAVTNQNKINYIHLMAHFRMHTQIREQTAAFIRGFRSIINPEWLSIFSTPEVQRLISGDNVPLDLNDLRRHTQYSGGFHDSHRVIQWLWDILNKDFNEEERKLFLKFVTSCSKPPLLGFAHLEPPFSIRCMEVRDDEDTGDTIGSIIRGFFTIRKKDLQHRLPTSATCFNLLKLPIYQRKSTLREKLRYAITSNTGFELS